MPTRRYPALYGDRGAGGGARGRRLLPVFAQLPPLARGSPQPPPHPPPRRAQSLAGRGPCSSPARTCGPPPPPAGGRWGGVVVVVRGATPPPAAATAAGLPRGDTRGRYRSSPAAAAPRCPAGPGALPHSRRWQVRRAAAAGGGGATQSQRAGAAAASAAGRWGGAGGGPGASRTRAAAGPSPPGRRSGGGDDDDRGSLTCRGGAEDSHDGHPPGRGLSEVGLAGVQAGQRAAHVVVGSHDPH